MQTFVSLLPTEKSHPSLIFLVASQSCLSCLDDGASSCSGSGTGEANTCGNNEAGMPTYLDSNYMCVTACGPCFYETSTVLGGNVCAACGVNALSCTDANTATLWCARQTVLIESFLS